MILYHGSEQVITVPQYGKGSQSNDFGRGFYCTESPALAGEWACKKNQDGFVNQYLLDETSLSIMNLADEKYHILNWLALLTRHRGYWQAKSIAEEAKEYLQQHYLPDISEYDVIIGYRADDSYFSFVQDFIMGTISLQTLSAAMRLGKLGEQIVLKSEHAFSSLQFQGSEHALASEYYVKKVARDREARKEYALKKQHSDIRNDIYMLDILRGRVSDDELRL